VYDFAQEAIEYIRIFVEVIGEDPTAKKDLEAIWCVFIFYFLRGY
jgi:hypothetical protein